MKVLQISADLSITHGKEELTVTNANDGSLIIALSGPSLFRNLPGSRRESLGKLKQFSRHLQNPICFTLAGKSFLRAHKGSIKILNWPLLIKSLLKNWLNI